ncbi:MAG: ferredoxin [Nitrospirae bacterium CG_4_9_14_3_um_filter_53_35]|nr:MAG: ferredoxin [Nitrospirae bacterium CG2_30_53_67]PIS38141.1 MAG: ferredoxin [Nitrospirae bacterium CG08_land_8_20_14_0_20_52_24]PIV85087.1 MAG: ferredoxin [Nitrospirae bacterium CG17_big_fil_post_rev_8_21_14_2_50_50_9]PIW84677.1 MAG: ferredoxin [Nitrospirae bacterium CG_4_8_14_3_um_filter_50_41]PIX85357.1 MAG: ferredoxin [Nitrospirae bacterium CG_4_10_14_3_um_filter_53_41]PJA72946.1 MAG: ferredoxin [Nitrospirae bacterium CG_4_9_14_3_um_filter_53_35]
MKPVIDQETCIGCGGCAEICPAVFQLNEEMEKAEVIDEGGCEIAGCCEAAAENCPVSAISLMDE